MRKERKVQKGRDPHTFVGSKPCLSDILSLSDILDGKMVALQYNQVDMSMWLRHSSFYNYCKDHKEMVRKDLGVEVVHVLVGVAEVGSYDNRRKVDRCSQVDIHKLVHDFSRYKQHYIRIHLCKDLDICFGDRLCLMDSLCFVRILVCIRRRDRPDILQCKCKHLLHS